MLTPTLGKVHLPVKINTLEDSAFLNSSLQNLTEFLRARRSNRLWRPRDITGQSCRSLYLWGQRRMGCPEVEDLEMVSSMDACVCVCARTCVCACVSVCVCLSVCLSSVNPQCNYSCQTANGQEKGALRGKHWTKGKVGWTRKGLKRQKPCYCPQCFQREEEESLHHQAQARRMRDYLTLSLG